MSSWTARLSAVTVQRLLRPLPALPLSRTLIWVTISVTCVRDHPYACVYTRALGTQTMSHHNICDPTNKCLRCFSVLLTGFQLGSWNVKSEVLPIEQSSHPMNTRMSMKIRREDCSKSLGLMSMGVPLSGGGCPLNALSMSQ